VTRILNSYSQTLENFTHWFIKTVGTATGFTIAFAFTLMWIITGIWLEFSPEWETSLIVTLALVTFLMIFLTQRALSKEMLAMQTKLNEIVAATARADNKVINIEESTEKVIREVHHTHQEIINS